MLKLQVILVSTRPSRKGPLVAEWFMKQAREHGKFELELTDLAEVNLPMLDEPNHPRLAKYEHEHTKRWSATVDAADAFVFVTPEYDFGTPAVLANAIQFLVKEWAYKPAAFVSYGGVSAGTRGVQMTKQLLSAVRVAPLTEAVAIPFFAQHVDEATQTFDPGEVQEKAARVMLNELEKWAGALKVLRTKGQ
jgi:NAD(P)H-dependent FMN reductase